MKKFLIYSSIIIFILVSSILIFSCTSEPDYLVLEEPEKSESLEGRSNQEIPPEVEEILHIYEKAVRTRNSGLLEEILTDDALLRFNERSLNQNEIRGLEAIAEFRLMFFGDFGPQEDFRLGEIENTEGDGGYIAIGFEYPYANGNEWFHFRIENGIWRMHTIEITLHQEGECVTNMYQALTDYNRDGFLNGDERTELFNFTWRFYDAPHDVGNQVDEFFDINQDNFIDKGEQRRAAEIHFVLAPQFLRDMFPWENFHIMLDFNEDGIISHEESEQILDYILGELDLNIDRDYLIDMLTWTPFPDALYLPVPREVMNILDTLADANGDGIIDKREHELILTSLVPAHRPPENYLEKAIDRNRDGEIHSSEIKLIMQDSAMGRGMIAEGAEPPYDIRTPIDEMLDHDRDGHVSAEDIEIAILAFSGDTDLVPELSQEFRERLDSNSDGRIEHREIEEGRELFFYPHPVDNNNNFDRELDVNHDGFIDPFELGITAGMTNKGEVPPFDEQINIVRRRSEEDQPDEKTTSTVEEVKSEKGSEYYRKLGTIQDKTLAVVTLSIGTDKIDQETANGVIVFVENAFVNVGKVKVIDRANIQEIFKEYKFQASGVIDETTAVEIGKLSGADIIVIGSINRVGGIFYLNIKLIAVQTAEIVGSSIGQAADATEFLEMTNQAVYKLF